MAVATQCQTAGVVYETLLSPWGIRMELGMPHPLDLTKDEAKLLEANLHNAVELVLAPYFKARK
jgi:hypothetical protein